MHAFLAGLLLSPPHQHAMFCKQTLIRACPKTLACIIMNTVHCPIPPGQPCGVQVSNSIRWVPSQLSRKAICRKVGI